MIDPDDLKALDGRIEAAVRAGVAAAVRMQAATLRSQASLLASEARTLDDLADGIEEGTMEPPSAAVRLAVVPIEEPEAPADDDEQEEPLGVVAVEEQQFGNAPLLVPAVGGAFTPEMIAWLDEFDDRLRGPMFVRAVNEAAAADRALDGDTARLVGARVQELVELERGRVVEDG